MEPDQWFERDEPDETVWAQGRLPHRTYASRSFPLPRPGSDDDGQPARFICKVFDPEVETMVVWEGEERVIRETPHGRYQWKLLVAREAGNVKELWIQRVPGAEGAGEVKNLVNLRQPEVGKLIEFLRTLDVIPAEGEQTIRVDDSLIQDLLASPDSLSEIYRRDPERFRQVITDDAAARDVVAVAARRTQVERFRRLLDDDAYFDSEVEWHSGRPEAVWQAFFEQNPWIFGVSLQGQFLMSWDETKLEQVVVGSSVAGVGKRTDALLRTAGRIRSMVFAEIKHHRTPLLGTEYRPGCWSPSAELAGGVAQVHGTVHRATTSIGERINDVDDEGAEIPGEYTYLLRPRSYLVVGRLTELTNPLGGHHPDKFRSFELFRRHLAEPEVITFDELFARAEWVVEHAVADQPDDDQWSGF